MILMKLGEEYKLYSHDSCIATTQESPHKRLSNQNCDDTFNPELNEIEVVIEMETKKQLVNGYNQYEEVQVPKLDENGCLILKKK